MEGFITNVSSNEIPLIRIHYNSEVTDVIDHPENETVIVQIDDTGEPCPCHPGCEKKLFYKSNSLKGIATAHIDEKYGVDVDNVHEIGEMLLPAYKRSI